MKLINGVPAYKRLGNNALKNFDMLNSIESPPEKNGFALRTVVLNKNKETIEIKKGKHLENSLPIANLKGIIMSNHSRALVKYFMTGEKPSLFSVPEAEDLVKCKVIPIQVMLIKGAVDLIMPNFESYMVFTEAYESIVKSKNNIKPIIKYLENNGKLLEKIKK